jgi:hydroxymethylbilane synthase
MWQARFTKDVLDRRPDSIPVRIVEIRTTGDRIQNVPLSEVGGKGLFTKELDEALLDGRIDLAVHSLKDLPFALPPGLVLAAIGKREDPRDAFLSTGPRLDELPKGARIGTSSLRRRAQLLHLFPFLVPAALRGNVDTRIRKLDAGEYDGIILAAAGLKRLGHANRITEFLGTDRMLPAIGQGALACVSRDDDRETCRVLADIDDPSTRVAVTAERALLAGLEGSCQIPVAGHATLVAETLSLTGLVASVDGRTVLRDQVSGPAREAAALGSALAGRLRDSGGAAILEAIRREE